MFWATIAETLQYYLVISCCVAVVLPAAAWGLLRVACVRAAVYRHLVWLWCMVGVAALPLAWVFAPKVRLAVLPDSLSLAWFVDLSRQLAQVVTPGAAVQKWLIAAWLAGVVVMTGRIVCALYAVRRIRQASVPVPREHDWVHEAAWPVPVLLSRRVQAPACVGIWRPAIIVPLETWQNSSRREIRMILAHERAHAQRRDCLVNLFQLVLEAVLFFHPLVRYASRQLTQEREEVCDNYVLADGAPVILYARTLAKVAEMAVVTRPLQAALVEGRLLHRVRRLLDPQRVAATQVSPAVWAMSIPVACLLVALVGVVRLEAEPAADTGSG